jgi:transposase-like protein
MNMHDNARLTPKGRGILIERLERGERPRDVAGAMGVNARTVYKWKRRLLEHGLAGLQDRTSRPLRSPSQTTAELEAKAVQLRRERRIMDRIAQETGVSRATVGRILRRHGLNRWRDLEPAEPVVRYERDTSGELIQIDIKKLGKFYQAGHRITNDQTVKSRGAGWECGPGQSTERHRAIILYM